MILLFWVFSFFGQSPEKQDTVSLDEIQVIAPAYTRFAQGQKVISWEKEDLDFYQGRSLSALLEEQSPVFIRQYGAGMLASPSLRGTSAGHTAIFWNGIPINSPSLGQSDLSILPLAAVDQVSLQLGSAGALLGNEAIGGTVQLESKPKFNQGLKLRLGQEVGSFGEFNTNLSAGFSNQKIATQTTFYRNFNENNFPFRNLSQPGTPEVRQEHAQVQQLGFVQDLSWNFDPKNQFRTSLWYNKSNREIQPVMGSNTRDLQEDQSLRWVLDYFHFGEKSTLNLKTGWVRDKQIFNSSLNTTCQFFVGGDWDFAQGKYWSFKAGTRFSFIKGDLSTYEATDQRIESYQSAKFTPTEKLAITANFRQLVYLDQLEPFIPGIGVDWKFWEKSNKHLELKASAGKGFKVPTLNDRFWSPGGNPDLLPEESINGEIGLHYSKPTFSQSLTYYRMNVDNWIIWLPRGSFWSPENIRKVRNQGLEYQGKAEIKVGAVNWKSSWAYNYTRAVAVKGISENDPSLGKQLPYTPQHQGQISLTGNWKQHGFTVSGNYTGSRSVTADNPRLLPSYQLFNAGWSYQGLKLGKVNFPVQFQVRNLLNTDYQVLYLRAMPGRSYHLNLTIHI